MLMVMMLKLYHHTFLQIVMERYKRTMADVTQNESSANDLALDEDNVSEIVPFGELSFALI